MLAILNNGAAVDKDMRDARRVPVWVLIRREIPDTFAREGDDVGLGARPDDAAIAKT